MKRRIWTTLATCALAACTYEGSRVSDAATANDAATAGDATGATLEHPELCDRAGAGADAVRDAFCADTPAAISSFEQLRALFDLQLQDPDAGVPGDVFAGLRGVDPALHVAVLGHSTALSGHRVSPINPRMIMFGSNVLLTFQRGVQRVELVARSSTGALVFYLLSFEQACNDEDHGCTPGDLYTAAIERDWLRLKLEDDEQLKNTPADCRQCHQRGQQQAQLLMRELESPWTHFFFPANADDTFPGDNGSALMRDYIAAKGDEPYGGIDLRTTSALAVFNLERVVGPKQPLLFDAPKIESERWPWSMETGYATTIQDSPTWQGAYEAFKRGEQLALPYLELRASDPDKQATLAAAYQRYLSGETEADELPDLADIFPDDPRLRARIGLATEPDASPEEALIQACGACHNDVLDQSISRAKFSIALGRMPRTEIDLAVARIELPREAPGAMPPPEARQLAPGARERLLEYLRSELDPQAIDPMLERAAKLGMTGGGVE
jgi:hypothetical protein